MTISNPLGLDETSHPFAVVALTDKLTPPQWPDGVFAVLYGSGYGARAAIKDAEGAPVDPATLVAVPCLDAVLTMTPGSLVCVRIKDIKHKQPALVIAPAQWDLTPEERAR